VSSTDETPDPGRYRIAKLTLDERTVIRRNADVEHERAIAISDLLEENQFRPLGGDQTLTGPYHLSLGIEDNRLVLDIRTTDDRPVDRLNLGLSGFRGIVRDYFMICESYYQAIRRSSPSQIEAIDMGRRGLHDEASTMLRERLADKVTIDHDTARRLFTLICVLHIRS
jgi:uncharacterized protein (UPF0262 family)